MHNVCAYVALCGCACLVHCTWNLGNIVEWKMPETLDVSGLEFKAIASGFHLLEDDYV